MFFDYLNIHEYDKSVFVFMLRHYDDPRHPAMLFNEWCEENNLFIDNIPCAKRYLHYIKHFKNPNRSYEAMCASAVIDHYISQEEADWFVKEYKRRRAEKARH